MVVGHEPVPLAAGAALPVPVAEVTRLLAVDPGTHVSGWANFVDARLVACGCWRAGGLYEMLSKILMAREKFSLSFNERTVVERPQVYNQRKWKGDPNDLVGVALVAGAVAALFPPADFVLPHAWKGSAPKDVVEKRVRKTLAPDELQLVAGAKKSDVWDAVGVGLWALGRYDKSGRTLSTGSPT